MTISYFRDYFYALCKNGLRVKIGKDGSDRSLQVEDYGREIGVEWPVEIRDHDDRVLVLGFNEVSYHSSGFRNSIHLSEESGHRRYSVEADNSGD